MQDGRVSRNILSTSVVGERNLVAEEQGGFRRGKGCRDQLLTLMLLGQIKAEKRNACWIH